MTKQEFTFQIANHGNYGILTFAARYAVEVEQYDLFVQELFEQDEDPGSRGSLKRILGEELYNALQKLK